jgi:predicted transcriptional regulator of viral defense system
MHLHGLIDQIPQVIFVATIGRSKLTRTRFGTYSFHRLQPSLFDGFEWNRGGTNFLIANPEKALVDSLYLSSRRGRRFRYFPELNLGPEFSFSKARQWAKRIPYSSIQSYVMTCLETLARTNRLARKGI